MVGHWSLTVERQWKPDGHQCHVASIISLLHDQHQPIESQEASWGAHFWSQQMSSIDTSVKVLLASMTF